MTHAKTLAIAAALLAWGADLARAQQAFTWRYYRPGNTGIQGDYNEAIYIGADGDPWIGGYIPIWEEGGVAKLVQAENRWVNVSNVDYPVIGHPDDVGVSRVTDIVEDPQGNLWMGTWRGALRFNLALGPSTLVRFGPGNSSHNGGLTDDVELAPDGSVFFSSQGSATLNGGVSRYQLATNAWSYLGLYGGKIASQPRPGGGFYLWASSGGSFGGAARWDSTTQAWTSYPLTAGNPRELISKDSVDLDGNMWMLRMVDSWDSRLDCMRPDGTWISPPLPPLPVAPPYIAAVRAFGHFEALLVDGWGQLQRFNGSTWTNLGPVPISGFIDDLDIDAAGNVWLCGVGGAARRDVVTGHWQRYRLTNTGNCDSFNGDLAIDAVNGHVYATANAAAGVGGMTRFDGKRWVSWNQATYGLGYDWPFLTDNSHALAVRPSNGRVVVSPSDWIYGVHEWTGSSFQALPGLDGANQLLEDSLGRLWAQGGTISLGCFNGSGWTTVPGMGGGSRLRKDPTRPGTVWAMNDYELVRTDGAYSFTRTIGDFPGSAAWFTGLAPDANGIAWVGTWSQFTSTGSTLIRLDASTGAYQTWEHDQGWPFPGEHVRPLAVTPDGRLWLQYDSEYPSNDNGLCWWDGVKVGKFQAPPGGVPQWGGLPHAAINDLEVREVAGGYELWMSFGSRGIAVLTVLVESVGTPYCAGDGSAGPCPCGNSSAAGAQLGCLNGSGSGAQLRGLGTASVASDNLTLQVTQMPKNVVGIVFMGASAVPATPFGNGLRCVGPPTFRLAPRSTGSGGAFSYGPGLIEWVKTHLAPAAWITPGSTWRFQGWFRDPSGPCGLGFNLSNALEVQFTP